MLTIILSLFSSARQVFQTRAALQAEILALRHQLLVLQHSSRGQRLRLSRADRFLWVWLARFWSGWRSALVIVKPETVIPWHRKGLRLYWKWKSRHPEGHRLSHSASETPRLRCQGMTVSGLTMTNADRQPLQN